MLKRFISVTISAIIILLCGCTPTTPTTDADKINILCSTFPQYDWVRCLTEGAGGVTVSLLIDDGTDIHSFQPSADDIINISSCDMFIYNGGRGDAAFEDILSGSTNESQVTLNMMQALGSSVLPEAHTEGAEHNHEHEHHSEYDEHIWLSLKNAKALCQIISEHLKSLDPDNADLYTENTNAYIQKLDTLDEQYTITTENARMRELIFVDRFPFRYLANDYSLTCHAAFPGCSAETDAGFNTILQLADKLDELGTYTAVTIEHSDVSIADTVKEASKAKKLSTYSMNSLQTVTREDIDSGLTYLSAMEGNLDTLKKVLN